MIYFLISISAILYGLAYILPYQLCWLIFPAFSIIFFLGRSRKLTFLAGFTWGLVAFGIHTFPPFYCLYTITLSVWLFVGWFLLSSYLALYAGLWFYGASKFGWVIVSWLFIIIMDRYCLWIFDYWEGYCCLHPLVPLMTQPKLFYFLPIIGTAGMTLLFLCTAASSAAFLIKPRLKMGLLVLGLCLVWSTGFCIRREHVQPTWLTKIGYARVPFVPFKKINNLEHAQKICLELQRVMQAKSQVQIIFMPESTLPCALNNCPRVESCIVENIQHVQLVLGSQRLEGDSVYNCCYWLGNNTVLNYYDKQHGVFFVERVPRLFNFLSHSQPFVQSTATRPIFKLLDDVECMPVLCSDLFFAHNNPAQSPEHILLCLANDAWFLGSVIPDLLFLSARLKSSSWGQQLLYVSYTRGVYFNGFGDVHRIDFDLY